jgi:hypothetical protein
MTKSFWKRVMLHQQQHWKHQLCLSGLSLLAAGRVQQQ